MSGRHFTERASLSRGRQGAATGLIVSGLNHVVHREEESSTEGDPNPNRNWRQDKLLSKGEIEKLQEVGWDHSDKGKGRGKKDLYKDKEGNVYQKPKGGNGPEEWTGHNLNDLARGSLLNKIGDGFLKIIDRTTSKLIRIPVIPEVVFMILDDGKINKEQLKL